MNGAAQRKASRQAQRDADDLAEHLRRAIGRFVRAVRSDAATPRSAQLETLGFLDREGSLSVADLAARRGVKHQSMRVVVMQLEQAGFTERRANPRDGRSQLVSLTPAGLDQLAMSRTARVSSIADLLRTRMSREDRAVLRRAVDLIDDLSREAQAAPA